VSLRSGALIELVDIVVKEWRATVELLHTHRLTPHSPVTPYSAIPSILPAHFNHQKNVSANAADML
jgi:hypothetical protein